MQNLNKVTANLLYIQLFLLGFILTVAYFLSYTAYIPSLFLGGMLAVLGVLPSWMMARRMPKVLNNSLFFMVMIICELLKWLVIVIFTVVLLKMYPNIQKDGLLLGFFVVYLGSYFGALIIK